MPQTNINIRMDEDLKNEFNALCSDMGLTMTAAFSVFAKTAVRQKKIPFEIAAQETAALKQDRLTLEKVFENWSGGAPEPFDWEALDAPTGRELL